MSCLVKMLQCYSVVLCFKHVLYRILMKVLKYFYLQSSATLSRLTKTQYKE